MLFKTVFMLKTLEARRKKIFGDGATGGFVIDLVRKPLFLENKIYQEYPL